MKVDISRTDQACIKLVKGVESNHTLIVYNVAEFENILRIS